MCSGLHCWGWREGHGIQCRGGSHDPSGRPDDVGIVINTLMSWNNTDGVLMTFIMLCAHLCHWSELSKQPQVQHEAFPEDHKRNSKIQQLKIKLFAQESNTKWETKLTSSALWASIGPVSAHDNTAILQCKWPIAWMHLCLYGPCVLQRKKTKL